MSELGFWYFFFVFFCEVKLNMKTIYDKYECLKKHLLWELSSSFLHFSYQVGPLMGAMTDVLQ